MLKRTVTIFLLIMICVSTIATALCLGLYTYNESLRFTDLTMQLVQKEIERKSAYYYLTRLSVEPEIDSQMKTELYMIYKDLVDTGKDLLDVTPEELKVIKNRSQADDIYLINKSGVIYNTTFAPDLNFNLFSVDPNMKKVLDDVSKEHEPIATQVGFSMLTGTFKKYAYYYPPGTDAIIEISIDVNSPNSKIKSKLFQDYLMRDYFTEIMDKNPYIKELDVYRVASWIQYSLVHEGKKLDIKMFEKLQSEGQVKIQNDTTTTVYTLISLEASSEVYENIQVVSEVTYDTSMPGLAALRTVGYTLIILLVVISFTFFFSNRFFEQKFLRQVSNIKNSLQEKDDEEYNEQQIESSASDEFSQIANSIASRKKLEKALRDAATHDTLTKLPNRLLFMDRLEHALLLPKHINMKNGLLFVDLDGFKSINDNFGHDCGDFCLETIAERLLASVRNCDTVARLGGDEFTIILEDIPDIAYINSVCERILAAVNKEIVYKSDIFNLSASIGVSIFPQEGEDIMDLISKADQAMYIAKQTGKNKYIYSSS